MQTAIKGGGGLVQQLRKSYSLSDLSECDPREERAADEADDVLSEPRLIRRAIKSAYATRRSASESNNRSPIYFPEVDVDVRNTRSRIDEPDFSHIKSTEDISSGYSSAENSASLTRTSSVGASRSRARTTRTTVTTIKRPQAAEDDEVIIEELQDDDSFDYANMPPPVNYTSPLFLSHTDPPFIYQYVGNQVNIVKLLGNYPLSPNFNKQNDNTDKRDQKEASVENQSSSVNKSSIKCDNNSANTDETLINKDASTDIPKNIKNKDNNDDYASKATEPSSELNIDRDFEANFKSVPKTHIDHDESNLVYTNVSEEFTDLTTFETLEANNYDSAESDDECSFGTPATTPKSARKILAKGKYGKDRAPLPPPTVNEEKDHVSGDKNILILGTADDLVDNNEESRIINKQEIQETNSKTDTEEIIVNTMTENFLERNDTYNLKPASEIDSTRKSPVRQSKGSSAFGKLLQLPGKLAFWHKTDDKPQPDNVSNASNTSRRSSLENITEDFQSCFQISNSNIDIPIPAEVFNTGDELYGDILSNDISVKSDALQKVINAKLENHPEYKFVSLHDEIPTTSKSTDV